MNKKSEVHSMTCIQEKRIEKMEVDLIEIKTSLNGTDGLMAIVVKQTQITETQGLNIDKLVGVVDALRVKDIEIDTEKEVKKQLYRRNQELEKDKRVQIRWFVGALLSIIGLTFTAIKIFF